MGKRWIDIDQECNICGDQLQCETSSTVLGEYNDGDRLRCPTCKSKGKVEIPNDDETRFEVNLPEIPEQDPRDI
jgi:hypothetical protein